MNEEAKTNPNRYEIVLLEDNPNDLNLLNEKLTKRGITVHAFKKGDDALKKIKDDPNIGALVTDIEIRYPFPNGSLDKLQGYDVANRIPTEIPNRLLSVIILTSLEQEKALDSQNLFSIRVYNFSKMKWLKLTDPNEIEKTFDELAKLIKENIEQTPYRWFEEVFKLYPKSRWVCKHKEKGKTYPPYREIYRKMWLSHEWKNIEKKIGDKALEIVQSYKNGELLKLQGGHLTLSDNPNEKTFANHLVGRRVVYALKAIEPEYWKDMIRGGPINDKTAELPAEAWQNFSEETKNLINTIHKGIAELSDLRDQAKKLENKVNKSINSDNILENLNKLNEQIKDRSNSLKLKVTKFNKNLSQESLPASTQLEHYLKYLWSFQSNQKSKSKNVTRSGGQDPVQQTLRILGIRKEDTARKEIDHWELILPEERVWLEWAFEKFEQDY